jgi:hypothetical protein
MLLVLVAERIPPEKIGPAFNLDQKDGETSI